VVARTFTNNKVKRWNAWQATFETWLAVNREALRRYDPMFPFWHLEWSVLLRLLELGLILGQGGGAAGGLQRCIHEFVDVGKGKKHGESEHLQGVVEKVMISS